MLVLTRRVDEVIRIDDCISLTILRVEGNQVRIGIDAPKEVNIHREEVYLRLMRAAEDKKFETKLVKD